MYKSMKNNSIEYVIKMAIEKLRIEANTKAPKTMLKRHYIDVMDITPFDLPSYMVSQNIPKDAEFEGKDNGYDAYSSFGLVWYTNIKISKEAKINFIQAYIKRNGTSKIHRELINEGYLKSNIFNSLDYRKSGLSNFLNAIDNDFKNVVEYYKSIYKKKH